MSEISRERLPDFLIIGAAKSGTTSLYHLLKAHPQVFLPDRKEPCYFDENHSWNKGLRWYKNLFEKAGDLQICGEASTNYTRWPQVQHVPKRIHALVPNVKLIYIIRSPVDRAYSHYVHRWTKELHVGESFYHDFFEHAARDPMCIDSSRYMDQVNQYLEYFDKEQILVIMFEKLVDTPQVELAKITSFLGINPFEDSVDQFLASNINSQYRREKVRKEIRKSLMNNGLARPFLRIIPSKVKDLLYNRVLSKLKLVQSFSQRFEPVPLTQLERDSLAASFKDSNMEISKAFKLETDHWK
jgi:hypothetical protein